MPGLLDRALNYRIPLGEAQLGPGPMLGLRGPTVNNLLSPLTDVRGSDQMLPPDFSLAELGGLLSRLPQAVSRENVINSTYDAIGGREYGTGRELGLIERFAGLFPAGGAQGGGAIAPATRAGRRAATVIPERDIPHGLDVPPEVPGTPFATPSAAHPMIGETFTDQFAAMKVWKEAGGKNGPIKITGLPEGSIRPTSWRIDPNEAAGAGAVPTAAGGHGLVGHGSNLPGSQPVSAKDSVDRRGMPGRDPLGPRTPLGVTDPEGRPLYQEALIAGIRSPGGPDVPLSMPEEVRLAERLATLETPRGGILGANGQVLVAQPGTMDPPGRPLLQMKVDADLPDSQYMKSFRHEGGHAIDYTTERTERGFESSKQYAVPADVRAELQAASADMRPELWAPNANEIYQRPTASLKEYRERPDELMADNYRYYKENPAQYKAKYPEAAAYIRAMVNDDPLLSEHIQFNVQAGGPMAGLIQVPQEEGLTDADLLQVLGLGPLAPGLMAVAREAGRKATPTGSRALRRNALPPQGVTAASLKDRA